MSWTDERVSLLKKLWGDGKTAAEIAKELGGVTRNAVIGKAHRLKLSNRASPIQQAKKTTINKAQNQNTPPEKKVQKSAPVIKVDKIKGGIALTDLKPSQCRWPQGDPREGEFGFCGSSCVTGMPYCEEHVAVAYQPATRNRILQQAASQKTSAASKAQVAASAAKTKKTASA